MLKSSAFIFRLPLPPPAEKFLRIFTSSWPFAQTCLQFKKCHGSTIFLKVFVEEQNCFPICRKFVKKMNRDAAQRSKHATHFLQQLL